MWNGKIHVFHKIFILGVWYSGIFNTLKQVSASVRTLFGVFERKATVKFSSMMEREGQPRVSSILLTHICGLWFTSFWSLLPTFPIMYAQVHLRKHTSSYVNLNQHLFSSFTLSKSNLSYPSLHSIDNQLHENTRFKNCRQNNVKTAGSDH